MTKEEEEEIRRRVIGYCLVCGSDELLVLQGTVKCIGCQQTYTVEYFFGRPIKSGNPPLRD